MEILAQKGEFSTEKYKAVLAHGNRLLEDLVKSQGVQWRGGKEVFQSVNLLDRYAKFQTFDKRIYWVGEGAKWEDYHMIVKGKRYEAPHKTFEDWRAFYKN